MLYREALGELQNWLKRGKRKPLIIRGARQVGKSTLVRMFATQSKIKLFELNLETVEIKSLRSEILDPQKLFIEIEAHFNIKLGKDALLFFDEIQKQPKIISALRYFYELRPEIPVICAGSLLEFILEDYQYEMPVGRVEYFHLGPLTFSEYLRARGKKILWEQIQKTHNERRGLTEAQHHQLTDHLREYIYIGGMPEAIQTFLETKDPLEVRRVHRAILETYKDDFPKYSSKSAQKNLGYVFERLPLILGRKMKYSEISRDLASRDVKKVIELLTLARVIHCCYHTNASGLPLMAQKDESVFKIYFLDVGLYNYLMGVSWGQAQDYNDEALLTKGLIAEQFIAQHLAYRDKGQSRPSLLYWLRDKKSANAELDFLIERDGEILPIEVKAGESGKLKSLIQFSYEKKIKYAIRFDLRHREKTSEKLKYCLKLEGLETTIEIKLDHFHLGQVELVV